MAGAKQKICDSSPPICANHLQNHFWRRSARERDIRSLTPGICTCEFQGDLAHRPVVSIYRGAKHAGSHVDVGNLLRALTFFFLEPMLTPYKNPLMLSPAREEQENLWKMLSLCQALAPKNHLHSCRLFTMVHRVPHVH